LPPVYCVCVCGQKDEKKKKEKKKESVEFQFFKPMNPVIRPLAAHFSVHNTVSLMKCPESRQWSKNKIAFTQDRHSKHA